VFRFASFPAAAYLVGLDATLRKRVQEESLEGRIEAIVATIVFALGIDKADIRTVIHAALHGSVEAWDGACEDSIHWRDAKRVCVHGTTS
jgi:superfamily II DNA helicase RecQ